MEDARPHILLSVIHGSGGSSVPSLLRGWEVADADLPSREVLACSAGVLVGSGLAELDDDWVLRLTAEGRAIRAQVRGRRLGMRQVPGAVEAILRSRSLRSVPVPLPAEIYDAAVADYLCAARGRRARAGRSRWWRRLFR